MKNLIRKILFEPLLHFLMLGMLLFIYFDYFNEQDNDNLRTITLSNNEIQELVQLEIYKKNSFLLDSLVQEKYYKKILLEEAFINELHIQDSSIRTKLIAQMQFLVDGEIIEPSEETLKKYYEENKEDYSIKSSISFYPLLFGKLDASEQKNINNLLLQSNVKDFEDKLDYYEMSVKDIELKYGKYFTLKLLGQKKSTWSKALNFREGIYSVYVKEYKVQKAYVFDEVIDRVYNDYKTEAFNKKRNMFFKTMKKKYILEVLDD